MKKLVLDYLERTGQSQAELARSLKVKPEQLNRWLHGAHTPSVASLKRLAACTGIKLERLAEGL